LESHRLGLKFLPPSVNEPGPAFVPHGQAIRVPVTRVKGLTARTTAAMLQAREHGVFTSVSDFFHRVDPAAAELEAMIRAGAFDEFGETRTRQFWQAQHLVKTYSGQAETELLGYAVSGHPLELFSDVDWDSYCPVNRLGEFVGTTVTACGLVVEQRTHHQITGEPMKFLSLADWTGIVETELFAATYKNYALATIRYPVLEVEARVEPFENGKGFSLRVLRAGKPRSRPRKSS